MNINKFDHFELKFSLITPGYSSKPGVCLLKQSVFINELNISPDNVIDLTELIESYGNNGEFNIVTCECGEAGCIGASQGIKIYHELDKLTWEIPNTSIYNVVSSKKNNANTPGFHLFEFERTQVNASIKVALEDAITLLNRLDESIHLEPYGFSVKQLHDLSINI